MSAEEKQRRLCSEIQLFDLCTKEKCGLKDGRFCTDESMLARFEAINPEDDFPPEQYLDEEGGEGEAEDEAYPDFGRDFDDDEDDNDEKY
jgi:hypothetical protein